MTSLNGKPRVIMVTPGPMSIRIAAGTRADEIDRAVGEAYQRSCNEAVVAVRRALAVQTGAVR